MKRRDGHTLVELLAVIAVASAIVGVAVTTLHSVLEAEATARQRLQVRTAVARLARQFRHDVHAARTLTRVNQGTAAAGTEWQFQMEPGQTVRYRLEDGRLIRTETAAGEIRGRDVFFLPDERGAVIEPPSEAARIATLRISPHRPSAASGRQAVRIDAWLGMNGRFSTPDHSEATP
jgi:type II secretory pathway pseudopilin PulG